jgi:hypothetical protein
MKDSTRKILITFGAMYIILGAIWGASMIGNDVEAASVPANNAEPLGSPLGMQQYEIRISGERNPVKVVEFINRRGNKCMMAYATPRVDTLQIELSCDYNK